MKRLLPVVLLFAALPATADAHCEVPCGIYGDKTRITILYEHVATIEKAMGQIKTLSTKKDALSVNQCGRWIQTKEEHAKKVQHIITQYFMTQRIKPASVDDPAAFKAYVFKITTLHKILRGAMTTKQTIDTKHCKTLRELIDSFCAHYFSKGDLDHIRKHHGRHAGKGKKK